MILVQVIITTNFSKHLNKFSIWKNKKDSQIKVYNFEIIINNLGVRIAGKVIYKKQSSAT